MSHDELKKICGSVSGRLNAIKDELAAVGLQMVVIVAPPDLAVDDRPGQYAHAMIATFETKGLFDMCFFVMDNFRKKQFKPIKNVTD